MIVDGCQGRYVMMDIKHVERILVNLLTNSVKFTPAGGKITLQVNVLYHQNHAEHTYIIRDNGIGIRESFQKKMFLPFEQDTVDGEYQDGTGLGLYICKNLVDLLGGTISCKSSTGMGTEFTVRMTYSLANDEQIALGSNRTLNYEDRILYGKNILLAEDNHIVAEVIIKILSTKGIHAQLARDGQEAVQLFQSHGPYYYQAILMDLMMPVMDGSEAAREIRQIDQEDAKSIPIIALTADISENLQERCLEDGMNECICKPIDPDRLFNCLAHEFEKNSREETN
ncbi:MAG: response regulator [Eubacterium sp.]|nr:response regulator [Eubacterium sp.]